MAQPGEVQAVVAGHICLDIIPDLSRWPGSTHEFFMPGKLVEVGQATLSTGGSVPNTGLALVILGIPTVLMGKIGDDPFGTLVQMIVAQHGGLNGLIVVPDESTAYTVVLAPGGQDRMFLHGVGANNTFSAADIRYDLVESIPLFHLGYPPYLRHLWEHDGRDLVEVFRRVKDLGVTTSLDMAVPDPNSPSGQIDWRSIMARVLPYVDIFLPSAEETLYMLDRPRYEAYRSSSGGVIPRLTGDDLCRLGDEMLAMGAAISGIKCGDRGFYVRTAKPERLAAIGRAKPHSIEAWADRELWHPTFRVDHFGSTTGAGDNTFAAFLAGYLRGHPLEDCLRYACAVGALNVTAPDALSGLRPWHEVVAAVKSGWSTNPLHVAGGGWEQDGEGVWHGPND